MECYITFLLSPFKKDIDVLEHVQKATSSEENGAHSIKGSVKGTEEVQPKEEKT